MRFMVSLLLALLLSLVCIVIIHAEPMDTIQIVYQDTVVQEMTVEQFEELVKASEYQSKIITAEEAGRVKILLRDDPWSLEIDVDYETTAEIVWLDENGQKLKSVELDITLKRTTDDSFWFTIQKIYVEVATYSFPALVVIIIILAL